MSFGVVQSAIASIKYNRSLLSKRSKLKNGLSASKDSGKLVLKISEVNPRQLKLVREKIIKENKRIQRKRTIAMAIIIIILVTSFCLILI